MGYNWLLHSVVFFFCSLDCFSPPSMLNYVMHYQLLLFFFATFACCFRRSFSLLPLQKCPWVFPLSAVSSGGLIFWDLLKVLLRITHSRPYSQHLRILFVINLCLHLLPVIIRKCLWSKLRKLLLSESSRCSNNLSSWMWKYWDWQKMGKKVQLA